MRKCCSFFGHRDFWSSFEREKAIKAEIEDCIVKRGITEFLVGGYGEFDAMCAKYLQELKKDFPQIRVTKVLAYLNEKRDIFEAEYDKKTFDATVYPPIEGIPPKFAIVKRNEWMIRASDFVIFFVEHNWGGAYGMLKYAISHGVSFANLGRSRL